MDSASLNQFLKFVYTGKVSDTMSMMNLGNVMTLADKYDMPYLYSRCLVHLQTKIPTLDAETIKTEFVHFALVPSIMEAYEDAVIKLVDKANVVSHLILAHSYDLKKLKKKCIFLLRSSGHII